ncbi:MAG: hypothetical protein HY909_28505 [Deltaproteobacteria bacterium]|nr:hypothetical protein [Deltaproteobacteria bacterium]
MLPALLAIVAVLTLSGLLGAALTGSPTRRWGVYLLGAAVGLGAPWCIPREPVLGRLLVGFSVVTLLLRGLDLTRASVPAPLGLRVVHAVSVVDSNQLVRGVPFLHGHALLRLLAFLALAAPTGYGTRALGQVPGWGPWALRQLLGTAFLYALVEVLLGTILLGYGLAGLRAPVLHRDPVLSRTLREFWGERWNRSIHESLWRHGFSPLARRGYGRAGIAVAFLASALLHVYLAAFAVDLRASLGVGLFFLAQGALVLVERRLGVPRWPSWAQRAWTVAALAGTVPLFLQGVLGALGW